VNYCLLKSGIENRGIPLSTVVSPVHPTLYSPINLTKFPIRRVVWTRLRVHARQKAEGIHAHAVAFVSDERGQAATPIFPVVQNGPEPEQEEPRFKSQRVAFPVFIFYGIR
jgi:hypothetical protein